MAGAAEDRRLHYDRVGQYRRRCGVFGHIQLQSEQRATRRRRVLCAGFPIWRTYTYPNTNTHGYTYTDGNAHRYTDSYSYIYGTANANAANYPNPERSSYSATSPDAIELVNPPSELLTSD